MRDDVNAVCKVEVLQVSVGEGGESEIVDGQIKKEDRIPREQLTSA